MAIGKLLGTRVYAVTITTETGLHIGSGDGGIEIGGVEQPVIKGRRDALPYVPGSSLKGKLRSLLEVSEGIFAPDGGPHRLDVVKCRADCRVCRAFGVAGIAGMNRPDDRAKEAVRDIGPTRLLVRDILLEAGSEQVIKKYGLEHKVEITMNRATGTAKNGGLRTIERVPAGAVFQGELSFRIFERKDAQGNGDGGRADEAIADGLFGSGLLKRLLESDCLGGHGSRGSGRVTIDFTQKSSLAV